MPHNNSDNKVNELNSLGRKMSASYTGIPILTTASGCPVDNKNAVLTVGPRGPMLMQDVVYMDEMAHFNRERIPERVVHAKGAGAHGYFQVTNDITKYCKATIFEKVGKRTPLFIRFSTVGGESGSADTARDPRGFAMKFYTEDGNFDLVGNNTPIFFIRDPFLFPSFIHTQKRNPVTHLKDPDMFWDFITLRPETMHQVMILFTDRGTPDGYRHMNGYGSHTFKLVNGDGVGVYCKFHIKTDQGIRNLTASEAGSIAASDPDYSIRDLYEAIETGHYPTWTFYLQIMTFDQAEACEFNPFDLTKTWPHGKFPLITAGKVMLDRNPSNYFAEVEQSAFSPSHLIPGIEPSPDKMLQGRLFAYSDTHFHRLGPNYQQLPINCPYRARVLNYQRDGAQTYTPQGAPNYHPNSFGGPKEDTLFYAAQREFECSGDVARYNTGDDDNYSQPRTFWQKVLNDETRQSLVDNISNHLIDAQEFIQDRAIAIFAEIHPEFGQGVSHALVKMRIEKTKKRAKL